MNLQQKEQNTKVKVKETDPISSLICSSLLPVQGFPHGTGAKNLPASAEDAGSVPGLGRSPGEGNGNPLPYSCLENATDRGAWRAIVHGVAKNWT